MLAKGAGRSCPRKYSAWKMCTRQRSLASSLWQDHQMLPICQPTFTVGVPEECVRAHTWAPWSVAAFPGPSSLWPWPALASGDTWVARDGFPGKSIEWGWTGASEGENSKGLSCSTWSWASVCRGLDHWRSWCHWPPVASLAKVSCLVDAMKMGGRYGLVEKLWAQFVLPAGPVNREVAWTRDEVLVGSVDFRKPFVSFLIHIVVLLLVYYHNWNPAPNFVTSGWLGKGSPFLQPWVRGAWRVIVGLHAHMGEGHFPSGYCECCRPFCRRCHTRAISARVSCVCSGWFSVPGC